MPHPRKLIRDAFKAKLLGATNAGANVFASRMPPVTDDDLPAILIYGREEKDYEHGNDGEDSYKLRNLYIITEAMTTAGDTVDDKLDDMADQIETLIDNWQIPGFESAKIRLHETSIDVVPEVFKKPVGAVGLTWHVVYRTIWRPLPDVARPDSVWAVINGTAPDQIISDDKGLGQAEPWIP